jgi:hypothetical protein
MSEDTDGNQGNQTVPDNQPSNHEGTGAWSRERWESLAGDPDEEGDLGYTVRDWEQFSTLDETDQVMFLPADESEIQDAAFIVAESDAHVDLENHC